MLRTKYIIDKIIFRYNLAQFIFVLRWSKYVDIEYIFLLTSYHWHYISQFLYIVKRFRNMHFKTTKKRWVSSNQFTTLPFGEIKSFLVFVVMQPIIQQMSSSCGYRSLLHVHATHTIDQNSQSFQITKFTISLCAKRFFYGSF